MNSKEGAILIVDSKNFSLIFKNSLTNLSNIVHINTHELNTLLFKYFQLTNNIGFRDFEEFLQLIYIISKPTTALNK